MDIQKTNSKTIIYILLAIALIFMVYNVIATAKEAFGCGCESCGTKEKFSEFTAVGNTGYFDQNVKKCPHGMISYALPGVLTKQKDC